MTLQPHSDSRGESPWASFAEVCASPFYDQMTAARREVVRLLRDDLYRLDEDQSDEAGGPYDCAVRWRYVAPGRAFRVTLWYGEQSLCATISRKNGELVAASTSADALWLDEVLP